MLLILDWIHWYVTVALILAQWYMFFAVAGTVAREAAGEDTSNLSLFQDRNEMRNPEAQKEGK